MSRNDPNPLNRQAEWSLSGSTTSEPATYYYDANGSRAMMANSAGEAVGGYKRKVAAFQLTWAKNIAAAGSLVSTAQAYINRTNAAAWAGGAARTWLCTAFSGSRKVEQVGDETIEYFDAKASFEYNADTHDIQLIDIGLNWAASVNNTCGTVPWTAPVPDGYFVDGNCIRSNERYLTRFLVEDENGVVRPNPKPQPLDGNGRPAATPAILPRQIYLTADFASFFGSPS